MKGKLACFSQMDLVVKYLYKMIFYLSVFSWLYYDFITIGDLKELSSIEEADDSEETTEMGEEINLEEEGSEVKSDIIQEGKK